MAKQLSATDKTAIVTHLLALGFDAPARLDLLWTDRLRALRSYIAHHGRPADQLAAEIEALATLTDGHALLMELLDNALRLSSDALPAKAQLAALITRLDDRGGALGLVRRQGGLELQSTELTVCLDRIGDHIRLSYRIGGQSAGPTANYPAAHAADPAINPFDLLFPEVRGAGRPDPLAAAGARPTMATALRLRVCTRDPQLEALDWWSARHDRLLVDPRGETPCTIEVTPDPHPTSHPRLARLPRMIVLSSDARRADALRKVLHMHSGKHRLDHRVRDARTVDDIGQRLGTRKAPVMLVEGLAPDELDALTALLTAAPVDHRPAAIILVQPPAGFRPGALLAGTAAVICADDIASAHQWLLAVVVDGCDPVTAAHCARLAAPLPVHATFARWGSGEICREETPLPALVLDRIHQRRAVAEQLKSLIKRDNPHRVEVFVAVGPPANKLDELAEQIDEHITDQMGELDFDCRPMHIARPPAGVVVQPPTKTERHDRLWATLCAGLFQGEGTGRDALLRRLAEQRIQRTDRVVWLDWGTFGQPGTPPLDDDELTAWLDWHQRLAGQSWPTPDLRIASFIALEVADAQDRDAIVERVELMNLDRRATLRYTPLPPVGKVKAHELREYLDRQELSRIHPGDAQKLAQALYKATRGDFVRLVELIERAWLIGIDDLLDELNDEPN